MNTKVLYEHKLFLILCKITLESGSIEKMYLMRKKKMDLHNVAGQGQKAFPQRSHPCSLT